MYRNVYCSVMQVMLNKFYTYYETLINLKILFLKNI